MRFPIVPACLALAIAGAVDAKADVLIRVDKAAQRMTVSVDGAPRYDWTVSTGKPGHATPSGVYRVQRMERDHFSREWDDAPMPYSLFFTGQGHAIHGSSHVRALGRPASHGCVRLTVGHAATLFALVRAEGAGNTRVVIGGNDAVAARGSAGRLRTALPSRPERARGLASDSDGFPGGMRGVAGPPYLWRPYAPAYGDMDDGGY